LDCKNKQPESSGGLGADSSQRGSEKKALGLEPEDKFKFQHLGGFSDESER
jgi:hypothetical protein